MNNKELEQNEWISTCELAVAGRPLSSESAIATLPCQKDLVLPESTSKDEDIRVAERKRPSPDQVAAQKGTQLSMMLLESALADMPTTSNNFHVAIVNLTAYVEDMGLAFCDLLAKYRNWAALKVH